MHGRGCFGSWKVISVVVVACVSALLGLCRLPSAIRRQITFHILLKKPDNGSPRRFLTLSQKKQVMLLVEKGVYVYGKGDLLLSIASCAKGNGIDSETPSACPSET